MMLLTRDQLSLFRGWFASSILMKIILVSGPVTKLILYGIRLQMTSII